MCMASEFFSFIHSLIHLSIHSFIEWIRTKVYLVPDSVHHTGDMIVNKSGMYPTLPGWPLFQWARETQQTYIQIDSWLQIVVCAVKEIKSELWENKEPPFGWRFREAGCSWKNGSSPGRRNSISEGQEFGSSQTLPGIRLVWLHHWEESKVKWSEVRKGGRP